MYLSRVQLDLNHSSVRRDIVNLYELHRTLCRVYAAPDEAVPRFLWRMLNRRNVELLLQSTTEPNWERLPQGYICHEETKKLNLGLKDGQVLRFSMKVNPTITTKVNPEDPKKKRLALYKTEDLYAWLHRQAERCGFQVLGANIQASERVQYRKKATKQNIVLGVTQFEGHLKVIDTERFYLALEQGIGHAKAFGLGMIMIAHPQQ